MLYCALYMCIDLCICELLCKLSLSSLFNILLNFPLSPYKVRAHQWSDALSSMIATTVLMTTIHRDRVTSIFEGLIGLCKDWGAKIRFWVFQ